MIKAESCLISLLCFLKAFCSSGFKTKVSFFLAPFVTKGGEQIKLVSVTDKEDELELEEELEDEELPFDLTVFWSLPFADFTISMIQYDCVWVIRRFRW
jgi:hypothetical protein